MSKNDPTGGSSRCPSLIRLARDESGVAIVEFAFVMPFMVLLAVGIMDMGMLLMKYRHATQVAASLAQTSAQLSVVNRDGTKGAKNTLTPEQNAMLQNGLLVIMGNQDAEGTTAEAKRVIRSANKLTTDWTWNYSGTGEAEKAFPLDTPAIMAQTEPGESLMVVDVAFTYNFFFSSYFGKSQSFQTHYTAGVPSY